MLKQPHLIDGPISGSFVQERLAEVSSDHADGALSMFLGQVRADAVEGKKVESIEYSAYEEMVGETVTRIKEELFSRFPDLHSAWMWHSTGSVKAGEASLLVIVTCGHRKESFRALEEFVELIKKNLPVWKKEWFTDGTTRWIE
jgi:molybdopterin synthase catalytic subunit